ncbi:MAG: GDP-L-fucose synthase [Pseudomonadota bacterium]
MYELTGKRVWVAGHRGMVGQALVRRLEREDCEVLIAGRHDVDLRDPAATLAWMEEKRPQAVFLAAAKVGGILANDTLPATFLYDNLMIEASVIDAAYRCGVEKLLFLGSSCIYPKFAEQPIREEALLTGSLEPTNEWYAVAKITGIKLAQAYRREYGCDFISAMPCNLYGPGDTYDAVKSHVIPALLLKADAARRAGKRDIEIWGTGTPRREFLHVDDCADALVHVMRHWSEEMHINLGAGTDVTIRDLAKLIMGVVGLEGTVITDPSKPDGTPRKLLDCTRLTELGWTPSITLEEGLRSVYAAPPFEPA